MEYIKRILFFGVIVSILFSCTQKPSPMTEWEQKQAAAEEFYQDCTKQELPLNCEWIQVEI